MKIYASLPHTSPLQFYQLLQTAYPNYTNDHQAAGNRVTASGRDWHWSAALNLTEDCLTVIGTFKGEAQQFETALKDFQQSLEQQQLIYLLEYEVPTAYGYTSHYLQHPAYSIQPTPATPIMV